MEVDTLQRTLRKISFPTGTKMKQKKHLLMDWVSAKMNDGFDCVQHNKAGLDNTVIWDPFALLATHKVFLDTAALRYAEKSGITS